MRAIVGLLAGVGLALLGWLVLVLGQTGQATPSVQWVRQAYSFKNAQAQALTEPKLVVVAGSNALFGIDSGMLEAAYGRPVVNQGVNAGLGLPYILEQGQRVLKAGDVALLPLEYPLFNYDFETNGVMVDYYFAEPGRVQAQPWRLQLALFRDISLARVLEGYRGVPADFRVGGLYGVQNMDARGDQLRSEAGLRSAAMLAMLQGLPPSLYGGDFSAANEAWQLLVRFNRWAQAQGVCAIFVPATMLLHPRYVEDAQEARFYRRLPEQARAVGLRYLGQPYDFMYSPEQYFDTNYHLVAQARTAHTQRLIELLEPTLAHHCR